MAPSYSGNPEPVNTIWRMDMKRSAVKVTRPQASGGGAARFRTDAYAQCISAIEPFGKPVSVDEP
jgi:hypothetical protein